MKLRTLLPSFLVAMAATTASAATITYDFRDGSSTPSTVNNSNPGNIFTFTLNGVTATVTAWSLTGANSTFQASTGYRWSPGMGICSATEGINCSSPEHQVDNNGGVEMFLIQFSSPVDPMSVRIQPVGGGTSGYDTDVTYYQGTTAAGLNLAGKNLSQLAALGFGSAVNNDSTKSTSARDVSIPGGAVTSLLFGARVGGDAYPDYFKLVSLTADCSPTATPEPATFAMVGVVLLFAGFARRKKA